MSPSSAGVVGVRLAAQRLVGTPFGTSAEAVRSLLAAQSQDAPLARFSLGVRLGDRATDADVLAAQRSGEVVRTHVLRPTWHFVHRDDLRWLLDLTAPRTISGMAGRHRQLGVTPEVRAGSERVLLRELAGRTPLTRVELTPMLPATDWPRHGDVVGHLLLLAELDQLVVSGPPRGDGEHTYVLADEVVPRATAPLDREPAVAQLVRRFLSGHGPATVADIRRFWPGVRIAELRSALADADRFEVDGVEVFAAPGQADTIDASVPDVDAGNEPAFLIPTFDELVCCFAAPSLTRVPGHPHADLRLHPAAAGGGLAVVGVHDLGTWKRTLAKGRLAVVLGVASGAHEGELEAAAQRLQRFIGAERLVVTRGPAGPPVGHRRRP